MLAKQILPWFGGTAAVWAVCMVFYQAALLAGYVYAHALTRFLRPRLQAIVHLGLVAASLAVLPVGIDRIARPESQTHPEWDIVWILIKAIGLPYFVLSSTSPLMQAWLARLDPRSRAYRLFGWSNLSCAIALISFPFVFEPMLAIPSMNRVWSVAYAVTAANLAGAAIMVFLRNPEEAHEEARTTAAPGWRSRMAWIAFSALGTTLLIGITNHLCQTVAPIPFLWTVPLLAYLLTFVAVFEREWYSSERGMVLAAVAAVSMAWAIVYLPAGQMLHLGIPVFVGGCFAACFYCHGELARRKPDQAHLTEFYILMAAGGAIGSLITAFAAPAVFSNYAELPVSLALISLLILLKVYRRYSTTVDMAAAVCAVLATAPALSYLQPTSGQVDRGRNFFGALRVNDIAAQGRAPALRKITHGGVGHGSQFRGLGLQVKPTAYYGPNSGPGVWFRHTSGTKNLGVIGLGAGTLATYMQPGDRMRFYEINPLVVDYARRHFTFLSAAKGEVGVAVGDGRLLLEAEPPNGFDLLVIDAFSGDSIPVHLLTREAFALYVRHLRQGGLLAFHLSNLYLNLQPAVRRLALDRGMESAPVLDPGNVAEGVNPSSWALVGRHEDLARLPVNPRAELRAGRHPPLWTDGFSSLLSALD